MNEEEAIKVIKAYQPKPPTFAERMWGIAYSLFVMLILLALVATIGRYCWNAITPLTGMMSVTWGQAFAVAILVRLTGTLFNLR